MVDIIGGGRAITLEPDKLGGVKEGGNDQLVLPVGVEGIQIPLTLLVIFKKRS